LKASKDRLKFVFESASSGVVEFKPDSPDLNRSLFVLTAGNL